MKLLLWTGAVPRLFAIFLFACVSMSFAQEQPSREKTIEYINILLMQMDGIKAWRQDNPVFGTMYGSTRGSKKVPLSFIEDSNSLRYHRTVLFDRVFMDGRWADPEVSYVVTNLPIKSLSRISYKSTDIEGAGVAVLEFAEPFVVATKILVKTSNPLFFDRNDSQETVRELSITFPDGDENNFRRLKNAFLRLKKIQEEQVDPFL